MRKKKILSAVIAAVMAFMLLPASVLADNAQVDPALIKAEQKIAAGQEIVFDSEEKANAVKAYLESKGYTNIRIEYNNPVIQVGIPIHWKENIYNPIESAAVSYPIDRSADFIVLTEYSLFSNSTVWVIPLRSNLVLSGEMIEEILEQSHLTSADGYDYSGYGQFQGFNEVTFFTEEDRTLVTNSPQTLYLKHEMMSNDRIGWVKRIDITGGPRVDFDWDCYFANDHALDYWGGDSGGYHGTITDDMCLIHSTSDNNRPYTYSTGRINCNRTEFGYYVTATPPESPEQGEDPVNPGEDPVNPGEDPVNPGEDPVNPGEDPVNPGEDPVNPGEDPVNPGEDPVNPDEDPVNPGEDPVNPGEDSVNPGENPADPGDAEEPEGDLPPETGDAYNIGVLLALMFVGGAGAAALIRKKRMSL